MSEITNHKPDLIFIDIVMPRLDGYQACSLIKRNRQFKNTPIVMLSSKDSLFDRARGRIVGAEAHINKPFSKSDLLTAVKQYISINGIDEKEQPSSSSAEAGAGISSMEIPQPTVAEEVQAQISEDVSFEENLTFDDDNYPSVNGVDIDSRGLEIDTGSFKIN